MVTLSLEYLDLFEDGFCLNYSIIIGHPVLETTCKTYVNHKQSMAQIKQMEDFKDPDAC